ncbi:MAG: hypothetical protein KUL88_22905 [Rhizobium sp.]|nr:hypothetical protein [Rhizobium sp.]
MKRFRTRLFVLGKDLPQGAVAWGLGWSVTQRHFEMRHPADGSAGPEANPEEHHHMRAIVSNSFEKDGSLCSKLAPELILEARDFDQAQRVMRLIGAGYALTDTTLLDEDAVAVPDNPVDYPAGSSWEMELALSKASAANGYFRGARVAAAASKKLVYQNALAKYLHGFRLAGRHWMDTHPQYGEKISTNADPLIYTNYALAIITFYSAIEELDAHVKASEKCPSKMPDGSWNPLVLRDLQGRLSALGVSPKSTVIWLLRGNPTRIERKHRPPEGRAVRWARGLVRDREIPICDAIHYAGLLRSRVSAHRTSKRTTSLTVAHVYSVQNLARDLLLRVLGPVDKVDSQISGSMIQDCLLGGSFGSRRPDGRGMADHRGAIAHRAWQEVSTVTR